MTTTAATDRTRPDAVERAGWRGTGGAAQLFILTGHELRRLVADRRVAVFSAAQPLLMLVLFTQIFGQIVDADNLPRAMPYVDYLLPAVLVTTGIGPAMNAGTALVRDMDGGVLTRCRSLPVGLFWVLCARSLADLTRVAVQLAVLLVCAVWLFGFTPDGGPVSAAAALPVALLVIWALMWVFLALAAWLRSLEIMQSIGFVAIMPLMFASSAFVPLDRLPGWLRAAATVNPITYAVDATRHLSLGLPGAAGAVFSAVLTSAGFLAMAMFCAERGFRRTTLG